MDCGCCCVGKESWMWKRGSSRRAMRGTCTAGCHHGTFSLRLSLCAAAAVSSCADTLHRLTPIRCSDRGGYTVVFLVRGTRTRWQRGEDRGLQTGPLWLRYTGKGAPRTRGGETGGASRSFGVIFLHCCDLECKIRGRFISVTESFGRFWDV